MSMTSFFCIPLVVAQANEAASRSAQILFWLAAIGVLSLVVVGLALVIRRRLLAQDEDPDDRGPGFLLSDLRRMHAEGKLSDEEFAAAKAGMIARSRAMLHPEDQPVDEREFPTDIANNPYNAETGDEGPENGDAPDKTPPR